MLKVLHQNLSLLGHVNFPSQLEQSARVPNLVRVLTKVTSISSRWDKRALDQIRKTIGLGQVGPFYDVMVCRRNL